MRFILIPGIRKAITVGLGAMLLLAVACGASSDSGQTGPGSGATAVSHQPAAATAVQQQAAAQTGGQQAATAAAGQQQPAATAVRQQMAGQTGGQQMAAATAAPEQPTAVAEVEIKERHTLKAGVIWLSTPLDPVESGWVTSQSGMSETLFRLSTTDLRPKPWLATDATQTDPLTWDIGVRSGVVFHNGGEMDAAAVKASLERAIRLSSATAESLAIAKITVADADRIIVTTTEPRPTLPGLLTAPATAIVDAAAADAAGEGNFIAARAMTGPYIPTEYVIKERLHSVANDDYWLGTPALAGIDHVAIADTNSRELALQAGDIDVAINVSPEGVEIIEAHPELRTSTAGIGTSVVMWWVNFERAALSDPLVRQAVVHAIDRESIAGLVAPAGTGSFANHLLPEALVSCPGVALPGFDPERARELLAEAGYADGDGDGIVERDGEALGIVIGGYPQRFQLPIMAEAAQAMLGDVGIRAEVRIGEWSMVKEPVWDLFGWYNNVVDAGDPVLNVSKFAGLEADAESSGANNFGHYASPELVDIIAQAGGVSDVEQRAQIACDALGVVSRDAAFLPVAHAYMVYGVSERVTGFEPHPHRLYLFDHRIGLAE